MREKLFEKNKSRQKKIKTTFLNSEHQILVKYKRVKECVGEKFHIDESMYIWVWSLCVGGDEASVELLGVPVKKCGNFEREIGLVVSDGALHT